MVYRFVRIINILMFGYLTFNHVVSLRGALIDLIRLCPLAVPGPNYMNKVIVILILILVLVLILVIRNESIL